MVIVVAPDSFKGSLSAMEAAEAIQAGLARVYSMAEIRRAPMADGGEGTLDVVLQKAGVRSEWLVLDAVGSPIAAQFAVLEGNSALIEVAQVVGLTQPRTRSVSVERRRTNGVGQLIRHALDLGFRRIFVGLGGSATNDCGVGLLSELGCAFNGDADQSIGEPWGPLDAINGVSARGIDKRLKGVELIALVDVVSPLLGPNGATRIFGPQKGLASNEVERMESTVGRIAQLAEEAFSRSVSDSPGSGAAGGMGFALQLLGARVASGADTIADLRGLDDDLKDAAWVVTGEGRSDLQTLSGKAPLIVARRAARFGAPTSLISGSLDRSALSKLNEHFAGCSAIPTVPTSLEDCIANAREMLTSCAEQAARLTRVGAKALRMHT